MYIGPLARLPLQLNISYQTSRIGAVCKLFGSSPLDFLPRSLGALPFSATLVGLSKGALDE